MRQSAFLKNPLTKIIRLELCILAFGIQALPAVSAEALENVKINGKLQALYSDTQIDNDDDIAGNFYIRRARIKISAQVNPASKFVLQTNYGSNVKTGEGDLSVIDAYLAYKLDTVYQLSIGQHMAPALRQNVTQAGALLAIDRPSLSFKSISWGARSKAGFTALSASDTDAGLRSGTVVRDLGATLLANYSSADNLHWKIYIGGYNGAKDAQALRYTGRVQFNLGDQESGYYNSSFYQDEKNTFSLGLSYDSQNDVALDSSTQRAIHYQLASIDLFTQKKLALGSIHLEAAYISLDLDDGGVLNNPASGIALSSTSALAAQGKGFYLQGAYTIDAWQPWFMYEQWTSDESANIGSFNSMRLGLSYFFDKGIACKFGLEKWQAEKSSIASEVDGFNTLVAGIYLQF